MLSALENRVMTAIFNLCQDKDTILISPIKLLEIVNREDLTLSKLDKCVTALYEDGFFDLIYSDRKGEKIYCLTIKNKGKAFQRNGVVIKRNLLFKLAVTVGFAILSFVIGVILKKIF